LAALDRVATMTSDQVLAFFASVRDHVIAFFAQLPDRVLLPVWEWILHRWEWIKDNPQSTIALGTLFVAVLVFRSSHKHNQLSVTPLLDIALGDYENRLSVSLVNNGTGPMVIKSITVIGAANPSEPLIEAMPDLPRPDLVSWNHYIGSDLTGRSIRAGGGTIVLLSLRHNVEKEKELKDLFALSRDKMRTALGPLKLRVEYTDIYEKRFVAERPLDYFLRNEERFVTERSLDILRNLPARSAAKQT
jgi:hypothetical protein